MEIKNTPSHRPKDMILDIAEEDAEKILKTGEFVKATEEKLVVEKKNYIIYNNIFIN